MHRVSTGLPHKLCRRFRVSILAWLVLLGVLLAPALAFADQGEAQRLFAEAEAAFEAGDYEQAARLFEQANRHAPHPSVLFNAAVSWDYAKRFDRAATDYSLALQDDGLSADQSEESERRLDALGERLGYVQIAKPVGGLVSVAHIEREPIPARFYLEPGAYQATLETPDGQNTTTTISVEAGQTLKVTLNTVAVPPPEPQVAPPPPPPPPPPPKEAPSSAQRTAGWISIGVGVAAAGVAIYLGTEALNAQDRFLNDTTNRGLRNEATQRQTQTNIAWGGAGLAGGLGLVLVLTAPPVEF